MHFKKRSIIILSILLLLIVAVLGFVYSRSVLRAEIAIGNLLRRIERGNINDINLTIYHGTMFVSTPIPWSVDTLIRAYYDSRIIVDGVHMEEHIDLINRLGDINLTPLERRTDINARVYYVFENRNGRRILDVAMFGRGGSGERGSLSVFVNGVELEWNDIFIEIILPFLPEYEASVWKRGLE